MDNYSILSRAIGEAFEPKLDEFIDSVNFDVNAEFSEKFERKMDKLIRRRNKPYFNLICTGGRRAACIVAAIIILSASSLSVEAVREAVNDFFMSIFGDLTLTLLLGGDTSQITTLFTPFTAAVFLVFVLLYTPCVAAIATVKRELGSARAAAATVLIQCAIAWVMAFLVRSVGLLFGLA